MFLRKTIERNSALVDTAFRLHQSGVLLPDTYILDYDALEQNAAAICAAGEKAGVQNYFMLKQLGRNPAVGQMLARQGFTGAVCVDWREAMCHMDNGIPLGHVGHLVQTPRAALERILAAGPEIVTVYTLEKAKEISDICLKINKKQDIMLRVLRPEDMLYPGQSGGVCLDEFEQAVHAIDALPGLAVMGVTGFPCLIYNEDTGEIQPTPNLATVQNAAEILRVLGKQGIQVNMPSSTCAASIPLIAANGGTHGEPGHGLSGTTPWHAHNDGPEIPALVYLSEVSHNIGGRGYCYGGGWYRRGHLQSALVGKSLASAGSVPAKAPDDENIDYHLELEQPCAVSDTVVMAFRTQIFVTRSEVAVVRGIQSGNPEILGIWSATGQRLR